MGMGMAPVVLRQLVVLLTLLTSSVCLGEFVMFQWKFNGGTPSSLAACASYSISVMNASANGSVIGNPPYYMVAFLPSGVPTTSFIGMDPSNLTWIVDQPNGSPLLLSVTDAQGDTAGQPSVFVTVVESSDTSCIPSPPIETITITPNFTSPITTCQPLEMKMSGGKKPYTLILSALDSPVVTNVTMGLEDDTFTYINRVDPGVQFMASVFDSNGVWGRSTQLFQTTGSANVSCQDMVSFSTNSSPSRHPKPAIPIAVSLAVAFILLVATLLIFYRRRRRAKRQNEAGAAILPDAWFGPSANPGSETGQLALNTRGDSKSSGTTANTPATFRGADENVSPRSLIPDEQPVLNSSDIVIQYRDGRRVQELPPPYFDHAVVEGFPAGVAPEL